MQARQIGCSNNHARLSRYKDLKSQKIKLSAGELSRTSLLTLEKKSRVAVVATISSGKSTFINAILGRKLMPSGNEACTAKIISIKHDETKNEFVNDQNQTVTLESLQELNNNLNQMEIRLKGPISSFNDIGSFEIIDTPGPNNSRDLRHREVTYDFIKNNEKSLIVIMLDGTKLLTDDEAEFIQKVLQNTLSNSNQSINENQFLFVVNKSDNFKLKDDDIAVIKRNICIQLEKFKISNPKIHFISAQNALLSRLSMNEQFMDEDDEDDLDFIMRKVKRDRYRFYEYSDLSLGIRKVVEEKMQKVKKENNLVELTLLTSGVIGLELSIKEQLDKL